MPDARAPKTTAPQSPAKASAPAERTGEGHRRARSASAPDLRQRLGATQRYAGNRAAGRLLSGRGNLPTSLRNGLEHLSGVAMDDVRVHYGSSKPRTMGALAYAEGRDIHLGPGQERHLPHEAWHIVQQKQGRVSPTRQHKDRALNDDGALEHEATTMGERARRLGDRGARAERPLDRGAALPPVVQRKIGFELQTVGKKDNIKMEIGKTGKWTLPPEKALVARGDGFKIETDNKGHDLEYISDAFDFTPSGLEGLVSAARAASQFHHDIVTADADIELQSDGRHLKLLKTGTASAHPHVTAGIPFTHLRAFYSKLAKGGEKYWAGSSSSMKRSLALAERQAYRDAMDALDVVLPQINLRTKAAEAFLVNVVTMYRYAQMRADDWAAKRLAQQEQIELGHRPKKLKPELPTGSKPYPIKLRTSAASIWNEVHLLDKEIITQLVRNTGDLDKRDELVQALFGTATPTAGWLQFSNAGARFGTWFDDIVDGREDSLAELTEGSGVLRKYHMESPTDVGLDEPGQIFEMRALKRNIHYSGWPDYMKEIVKLLPKDMIKPDEIPDDEVEDLGPVDGTPPLERSKSAPV